MGDEETTWKTEKEIPGYDQIEFLEMYITNI
jgi:hypothetical protein